MDPSKHLGGYLHFGTQIPIQINEGQMPNEGYLPVHLLVLTLNLQNKICDTCIKMLHRSLKKS